MNVAVLIILIIVGGIILWGALTGWTFSGIFGDAKGDSPPTPITNVQVGVSTGESGGRRESYTTVDEMMGLSITISFNTPSSFGFGDLELKDYVISLGTATSSGERDSLVSSIIIPRNAATGGSILAFSPQRSVMSSGDIALSGDFNARDEEVSITLSDIFWGTVKVVFPEGGVFLGIDYTPMEMTEDYGWPGTDNTDNPAGAFTRQFISGGVTLIGEVKDDAGFVVNPDVTESVNEQLNIAVVAVNIGGARDIRKQIPRRSRFLISPADRQDKFLGFPAFFNYENYSGSYGIQAFIFGQPQLECILDRFRGTPDGEADSLVNFDNISKSEFYQESNWFNFVIMEERSSGWVRLGLSLNFESDGERGGKMKIKRAQFPVIRPVFLHKRDDKHLSYHKSSQNYDRAYFRFVSPVDRRDPQGDKFFSLCVRWVQKDSNIDDGLSADLTTSDLFLVSKDTNNGVRAELIPLHDIVDFSKAVFTKRRPWITPPIYVADKDGQDRWGHDLDPFPGVSLEDCEKRCTTRNDCAGISYRASDKYCWLKGLSVRGQGLNPSEFIFYRKQTDFEMPAGLTDDGDAAMSKSFWGGPAAELNAFTAEDCEQQAKARGAPAYTVRTKNHGMQEFKNTCYILPNNWSNATRDDAGLDSHYTVCTDPTKKVKNACK